MAQTQKKQQALKVAEIHDVYMAVSGESVCEEVHPCRVIIIYSNSRIPRIWKLSSFIKTLNPSA